MTPDEIETAAIEALAKNICIWDTGQEWPLHDEKLMAEYRHVARGFARTYERAMWRPIDEAPKDGTVVLCDPGRLQHFDEECGPAACQFINGYWFQDGGGEGFNPEYFRPLPRREGE